MSKQKKWKPKPGDLAIVTFDDGVELRAMRDADGAGWGVVGKKGSLRVASARPLLAIDPEAKVPDSVVEAFKAGWAKADQRALTGNRSRAGLIAAFKEMAKPTPDGLVEPNGLGAVVEDEHGARFVLRGIWNDERNWVSAQVTGFLSWDEISAVRILSEGVPAA